LIDAGGRVLVQRRPEGKSMAGLWEFPGGKVELNELPEHALVREIQEELGMGLRPADLEPVCFARDTLGDQNLVLLLYLCTSWIGVPHPHDGQLVDWVSVEDLGGLAMPPADIPLIRLLKKLVKGALPSP
jgi:8-oxo-dGTP diphosphatase